MANADTLITGATGFIGGRLLDALDGDRPVRALVRDASKLDAGRAEVVEGDLTDRDAVRRALDGVQVAYYLVHSMEAGDEDFATKDREMAETFLAAAEEAGVQRLVYLGGVEPDGHISTHLQSRLDVEQVLGSGSPDLVALRASMVVGAESDSFRTLAQIVGRIPVLALPPWRDNKTQPIAVADVIEALVAAREVAPGVYDVGGPDEVTIERMCEIIGEQLGDVRPSFSLPLSSAKLEAVAAATVADSDRAVLEPLLEGMHDDLRVKDNALESVFGVTPTPFRDAASQALAEMEPPADERFPEPVPG